MKNKQSGKMKWSLFHCVFGNRVPVKRISVPLLQINERSRNGNIYSLAIVQEAIEKLNSEKQEVKLLVYDCYESTLNPTLEDVVACVTNIWIDKDVVMGQMDVPDGIPLNDFVVRPCGVGKVDSSGVVSNYSINCAFLVKKEDDAFQF